MAADEWAVGAPNFSSDARRIPDCRPSKIVCIGLNFRDHAAETHAQPPAEPVIFFISTTSVIGPNDEVVIPKGGSKLDWEVGRRLSAERQAA